MSRLPRKRWAWLVLAAAALAVAAWWWRREKSEAPTVPEVQLPADAEAPFVEAVAGTRQIIVHRPGDAAAWGRLGELLLANGCPEQAEPFLAQAEKLQPNEPRWPYYQAIPLLLRNREAAIPYLQRTVALCDQYDPDAVTPRLTLAEVYLEKGDLDAAEPLCRQVLERQSNNPRAHFNLGVIALERNDLESSVTHLTRAAGSPFARKRAYVQLAAVYQRRGDRALAETCSRQAQQARPDLPWQDPYVGDYQHLAMGRQHDFLTAERLDQEGRLAEETKLLMTIADERPDDRSYVALGVAFAKMKNYPAAEEVLRRALKQSPDKINAHFALGVVLFHKGEQAQAADSKGAADLFRSSAASERRVLELKPDHAMAQMVLGMALNNLGDKEHGIAALRSAVRCRPELAIAHLRLGEALAAEGQKAEALRHLRFAVELSPPEDPHPREALARLRGDNKP